MDNIINSCERDRLIYKCHRSRRNLDSRGPRDGMAWGLAEIEISISMQRVFMTIVATLSIPFDAASQQTISNASQIHLGGRLS